MVRSMQTSENFFLKRVPRKEYDKFCKEFIFQKIQGKSFVDAFCEKFEINNFFLLGLSDTTAKMNIEQLGYIEDYEVKIH